MTKARREMKMVQAVQNKEAFRTLLSKTLQITYQSTHAQVESLLGGHEIWDKVDPVEREEMIRDYLKKLQQKEREVVKDVMM